MHKALLVGSVTEGVLCLQSYFKKKYFLNYGGSGGNREKKIFLLIHVYFLRC